MLGAIEAGGTKFVCGIGTGPENLDVIQIPTTTPELTLAEAVRFFQSAKTSIEAVGIGSFGPVDLRPGSASFGYITSTPKPGWRDCDFAGVISRSVRVPVGFDTDVNAAALGSALGRGGGLTDFMYLTIGTGIGGGALVNGRLLHGLMHPEMGHIRIPHDRVLDPFPGNCPFHRDCLEGLASGPAMQARWGSAPEKLPADHPAWILEAHYLALGLVSWICALSPQRIIMGGGVMQQPGLFAMIRKEVVSLLGGYIQARELIELIDQYLVPPKLGSRSGILGALALAETALVEKQGQATNSRILLNRE